MRVKLHSASAMWLCGLTLLSAMASRSARRLKRCPNSATQAAWPASASLSGQVAMSTVLRSVATFTEVSEVCRARSTVVLSATMGRTTPRAVSNCERYSAPKEACALKMTTCPGRRCGAMASNAMR
jgi:hypothetical protein